jgi:hypothetical protein
MFGYNKISYQLNWKGQRRLALLLLLDSLCENILLCGEQEKNRAGRVVE